MLRSNFEKTTKEIPNSLPACRLACMADIACRIVLVPLAACGLACTGAGYYSSTTLEKSDAVCKRGY